MSSWIDCGLSSLLLSLSLSLSSCAGCGGWLLLLGRGLRSRFWEGVVGFAMLD